MKLFYLSPYRLPTEKALGVQIINMCVAFAENGADVSLLTPWNKELNTLFSFYGVPENFTITPIRSHNFRLYGPIGYWLKTFSFVWHAKKYIRKEKDVLIYTREPALGLFLKNHILELHALPNVVRRMHILFWTRAQKIVVLTTFMKNQLVEAGIPEEKVLIAFDAVGSIHLNDSTKKPDARERFSLPKEKKIIAYVGKYKTPFAPGKGVDELVEVFPKIQEKHPESLLLLVGMNNEEIRSKLEAKCESLGLKKESYEILGHVTQEDVVTYMRAADVLMMNYPWSTHHAYQMSSMKLFEYMAAERPIIASRLPSVCEVLNEENAVLIEPDNEESLYLAIDSVLSEEAAYQKKAEKARNEVESMTWKSRAESILSFIASN